MILKSQCAQQRAINQQQGTKTKTATTSIIPKNPVMMVDLMLLRALSKAQELLLCSLRLTLVVNELVKYDHAMFGFNLG